MIPDGIILELTPVGIVLRVIGLSLLAGVTAGTVGFIYRARFRDRFPDGASLIVGLGVVAIYLNTRLLLVQVVVEDGEGLDMAVATTNLAVFIAAGATSLGGRTMGDRLGTDDRFQWHGMEPAWSPLIRASGRYISITLPDDIDDIDGYDPVSTETKTALVGRTLDFPRGLTKQELESQLKDRLTEKHDVGYVDAELTPDGELVFLALGQRVAGLGPTIPPGMAAVAIRGDPPFSASPGDAIEIWETGGAEPLGRGELRATVDSVATIACDVQVAERIDPDRRYRLVTIPGAGEPDRDFAAMLRRSAETMSAVTVRHSSPLVGSVAGALDILVIALERGEQLHGAPVDDIVIEGGDRLYVLGLPDVLRRLEATGGVTSLPPEEMSSGSSTRFDGNART